MTYRERTNNKLNPHVTSTQYSTFELDLSSLSSSSSNLFYLFPPKTIMSHRSFYVESLAVWLSSAYHLLKKISNHHLVVFSLSLFFSNEGKDVNKPEEHLLQWWLHCESLDLLYQQTSLAYKTKSNVLFGTWTWTTWLYPFVVCCNFIRG